MLNIRLLPNHVKNLKSIMMVNLAKILGLSIAVETMIEKVQLVQGQVKQHFKKELI